MDCQLITHSDKLASSLRAPLNRNREKGRANTTALLRRGHPVLTGLGSEPMSSSATMLMSSPVKHKLSMKLRLFRPAAPDGIPDNSVTGYAPIGKEAQEAVAERQVCRRNASRMRRRASSNRASAYCPIMRLIESNMNTTGKKFFGAIIGSATFFGVGMGLAHAGSLVA
jgi:hypothetical protein